MTHDVIVIGLGAMGSAASCALARSGKRVLGIDRHAPPHALGSSHGKTRIIREAYWEHPLYVPLVRRAYQLWHELERDAGGKTFLRKTGGLVIGSESGPLVTGALQSVMQYRIPHEVLSAGKLHRRFPAFAPLDEWVGVLELRAGILFPEPIIAAYLQLAARHGAELRVNEEVLSVTVAQGVVQVTTSTGSYEADQAVVCVGPWTPGFLPELALPLTIERQMFHWFDPARDDIYFTPERMPVSLWELAPDKIFYTTPNVGDGVKVGMHHSGETTTADTVRRTVSSDEDAHATDLLRRFVPFAKGRMLDSSTCLYTNTPDGHFILDRHPAHPELVVMSPCSGHGFKFACVLAEAVTDLVHHRPTKFDLSPFALARFATG